MNRQIDSIKNKPADKRKQLCPLQIINCTQNQPSQVNFLSELSTIAYHQFYLMMIRKIKHEFYDLLESMLPSKLMNFCQSNESSNSKQFNCCLNDQIQDLTFDPVKILQTQIFEGYEKIICSLIQKEDLSMRSHKQQIQISESGKTQQNSSKNNVESGCAYDQKRAALIPLSTLEIGTQVSFREIKSSFNLLSQNHTDLSQIQNVQDCPYCESRIFETKKLESAQRQLQLLIRQKQMSKKIAELSKQLIETRDMLEQRENQLSKRDKQLKLLAQSVQKQKYRKQKQQKIKRLKDKIQIQSMRRELCLEREKDNMKLRLQKQNIHINYQNMYLQNLPFSPSQSRTRKKSLKFNEINPDES